MASVALHQDLTAPADAVWDRIGGFATLHEWHPAIEKTEMDGFGVGATRNLFLAQGGNVIERLDVDNPEARLYTYTILESPLPVRDYQATIRIEPTSDDTCTVHWSAQYEPDGVPEDAAAGIIHGIFESGLAAAAAEFGA